jgi:hypothetical protein
MQESLRQVSAAGSEAGKQVVWAANYSRAVNGAAGNPFTEAAMPESARVRKNFG